MPEMVKCEVCKFYQQSNSTCHRRAPEWRPPANAAQAFQFPRVNPADGCGDGERKN